MKYETLEKLVTEKQKGAFSSMMWTKELPTLKAFYGNKVEKVTKARIRFGVTYDNMQSVKDKRESGELPQENQGLPWGKWKSYPYFIEHNGNIYLRVSLDTNPKIKSNYFLNGLATEKEIVQEMCQKSAFPQNATMPDVLTININNVIYIKEDDE